MKRFFAGLAAAAMIASVLPLAVNADGITAQKTNYIVGTSGKLSGGSNYSSSADDIVKVESDGTIMAVAPGTATISSDSGSVDITVHDKAKADFVNDIQKEYTDGKIGSSFGFYDDLHTGLKDSNIWAIGTNNSEFVYSVDEGSFGITRNALINNSGWYGGTWAALVYKPDMAVGSADIQLYYDANTGTAQDFANQRIYVGYRTDDYSWQTDRGNALSEMRDANGDGYSSRRYDVSFAVSTSSNDDKTNPKLNEDIWTKVPISEKNITDYSPTETGDLFIRTSDIPENAKYIVVMVNNGALDGEDASAEKYNPRKIGFRGVTIHSPKSLAAGEVTADNKIALTYNGDTENPSLTVKKNGNAVETNVTYDAATYTSYIDGAFSAGDYIEVTSPEGYNWSGTISGGSVDTDYDNVYFSTERTVYVEGTSGKIDLIAKKGNETWKNPVDTTYVSSNEDVVKVDNKGNITAVSAGTAVITPSVDSMPGRTFGTITVNVYTPSTVESFITDEIDAGKLDFKYDPRADLMSSRLHGSKLKAYTLSSEPAKHEGYVYSTYTSDDAYMGFVYKLEGEVESIKVENFFYGDYMDEMEKRTVIGYLTDDTKEFYNQAGEGPYTWNSENLNMYGVAGGILDKPIIGENETIEIDPIWTVLGEQDIKKDAVSDRVATLTATGIPADAKYAVVLMKLGKLPDGTAAALCDYVRYKGATINYKKKLLDGTLNEDNKAVLTFNTSARDVALNITKNGAAAENPTVTYSADGYTAYVDAGLTAGDEISVTTDYGSFEQQVKDTREQVESISVTDEDGTPVDVLIPESAMTIKVKANVINTDEQKLTVYAALYDESGSLVKVSSGSAVTAAQKAAAETTLTIDAVPTGAKLRIFTWGGNMNPFAIYNNIQTEFEAEEF